MLKVGFWSSTLNESPTTTWNSKISCGPTSIQFFIHCCSYCLVPKYTVLSRKLLRKLGDYQTHKKQNIAPHYSVHHFNFFSHNFPVLLMLFQTSLPTHQIFFNIQILSRVVFIHGHKNADIRCSHMGDSKSTYRNYNSYISIQCFIYQHDKCL